VALRHCVQCGQSHRSEPWRPRIIAQLGLESTFPAYDLVSPNDEPKNGSRPPIPTQSDEMAIKQAIALPPLCGTEPYAVRTYERQSYVSSAISELHISKLYYDRCRKLLQSNHFRVERKGIEPSTSALRRLGSVGVSIPSEVGRARVRSAKTPEPRDFVSIPSEVGRGPGTIRQYVNCVAGRNRFNPLGGGAGSGSKLHPRDRRLR
jgi:hypothetical protein